VTITADGESTTDPLDGPDWMRAEVYVGPRTFVRLWSYVGTPDGVPFGAVVRAQRQWVAASAVTPATPDSDCARDEARYLYTTLRAEFARLNGRIVHEYYCRDAVAAAVLTDATDSQRDYRPGVPARALYTVLNTSDVRLQSLESQCDSLVNDAVAVFADDKNRKQLHFASESAYHAMAAVLFVADQLAGNDLSEAQQESALSAAASKVHTTAEQVQILIQRHARFSYFCGVLVGSVIALGVCAFVGTLSAIYWNRF
jgi:hypothetical protein